MKLIITTFGNTPNVTFDPHIGHAQTFCLIDTETEETSFHPNPGFSVTSGAGIQAARAIVELGAKAVISDAYGPHAFNILKAAGIEMYVPLTTPSLTVPALLELFRSGKLTKISAPNHVGHHRQHHHDEHHNHNHQHEGHLHQAE